MANSEPENRCASSHSKPGDEKEPGSPTQDQRRQRSRSPRRDRDRDRQGDRPRRKDAGFKWKDRRRDHDRDRDGRRDRDRDRDRDSGLQRGYRDHYRPRSRSRSPPPRRRSPRRYDNDNEREDKGLSNVLDAKGGADRNSKNEKERKEKKPAAAPPQAVTQPMIIVYVNDRLGTKKAIPCYPTDPIKDFKVIVASMIGRQPHEILLKRQGERPFKDQLTLQDYGVSNNVQLDLEVDTGD
ncbi:uncharacterized protein A1O9_01909 [Exophiala aquamarina CBS 119918]|uniref:Ubiquitin-like modifier HUB1 n=1 Tax=Exophiala aquamarina CBS 119918 TaxID=1182545 RepID=A0A072PJT6_9EURO|nr:uncharacterized protein A1O9_01909 [Exophiala aquamarina CBS 119918]KEF60349.1 hypothetical protein A1O9_01909 [Exophiala aquamarina CBS 119918]